MAFFPFKLLIILQSFRYGRVNLVVMSTANLLRCNTTFDGNTYGSSKSEKSSVTTAEYLQVHDFLAVGSCSAIPLSLILTQFLNRMVHQYMLIIYAKVIMIMTKIPLLEL